MRVKDRPFSSSEIKFQVNSKCVKGTTVLLGNDSDVCRSRYRLPSWYEGMWVRIAILYSQAGMVDNAHNVFDEMLERKRWDLGEKSLCGVFPVLVGNGVFGERLDKVLEFVEKTGVKSGVKANNLLARGYVKGGRLGDAEELVRKMESCEIVVKPDIRSYNNLLVEYFMIYKHMVKEGEFDGVLRLCKDIIRMKWVPPFKATKLLVSGLVKNSKSHAAREVVESFKKRLRGLL